MNSEVETPQGKIRRLQLGRVSPGTLETNCPHCDAVVIPLLDSAQLWYCPYCQATLGLEVGRGSR